MQDAKGGGNAEKIAKNRACRFKYHLTRIDVLGVRRLRVESRNRRPAHVIAARHVSVLDVVSAFPCPNSIWAA